MTAQAVLLAWPVVTLVLFLTLSAERAIIASLLAGYLLLPISVGFDFPAVPRLDKSTIPSVAAFLIALGFARPGQFRWPRSPLVNLCMATMVVGPVLTGFMNRDPITIGSLMLSALTLYSSISWAAENAIALLPFILGAALLRTEKAHRDILLLFVLAGLAYSVPVLLEIAKGPFFQAVIYHVDPGAFYEQQMRGDSFRAMVFLGHGLLVSSFLGLATIAGAGMWRAKQAVWGIPAPLYMLCLFAVLMLNKSLGAIIMAIMAVGMLAFLKPRRFLTVSLAFAMMVVTYPILRANQLIPVEEISSLAGGISEDRASSFGFRLKNEDMLLERAQQRPLLGWGNYGRNRVYMVSEWGPPRDISVTDGTWIIAIGTSGWIGYLAMFGLLCYPFLHLFKMRRSLISPATTAIAAMLLFNLLDLVPNSSLRPVTWLLAGALAGYTAARPPRKNAGPDLSRADRPMARVPAPV